MKVDDLDNLNRSTGRSTLLSGFIYLTPSPRERHRGTTQCARFAFSLLKSSDGTGFRVREARLTAAELTCSALTARTEKDVLVARGVKYVIPLFPRR